MEDRLIGICSSCMYRYGLDETKTLYFLSLLHGLPFFFVLCSHRTWHGCVEQRRFTRCYRKLIVENCLLSHLLLVHYTSLHSCNDEEVSRERERRRMNERKKETMHEEKKHYFWVFFVIWYYNFFNFSLFRLLGWRLLPLSIAKFNFMRLFLFLYFPMSLWKQRKKHMIAKSKKMEWINLC